jgi:DHA1 family tetracycline resistance protein-like MFS transporter
MDYRRLLPVFLIVLIDLMGLTIVIPLLPLYAASFGAGPALIGVLGATYPIMQFLGAPVLGRMSDAYGRKSVLLLSQLGTLVGFAVLGLASSLWMLFLSRAIDGLSGANIATAQAVVSDSTTERTRTQGMGLIGVAFGIGFVVGPVIAFVALALGGNDYHVPAFIATGFSALSVALTWWLLDETLPVERRRRGVPPAIGFGAMAAALRHPGVGVLLVLAFLQQFAFGGFEQLLALFNLSRLGLAARGNALIFVVVGVLVVIVQGGLVGRWSRRYGETRLVVGGLASLASGLLLLAATPRQPPPTYSRVAVLSELAGQQRQLPGETPPTQNVEVVLPSELDTGWLGTAWLLAAMVPLAIGGGVLYPSVTSLLTKRVGPLEVGGTLGLAAAFVSLANATAPLVGGAMFQQLGDGAPFALFAGVAALSLAMAAQRLASGSQPIATPDHSDAK